MGDKESQLETRKSRARKEEARRHTKRHEEIEIDEEGKRNTRRCKESQGVGEIDKEIRNRQ